VACGVDRHQRHRGGDRRSKPLGQAHSRGSAPSPEIDNGRTGRVPSHRRVGAWGHAASTSSQPAYDAPARVPHLDQAKGEGTVPQEGAVDWSTLRRAGGAILPLAEVSTVRGLPADPPSKWRRLRKGGRAYRGQDPALWTCRTLSAWGRGQERDLSGEVQVVVHGLRTTRPWDHSERILDIVEEAIEMQTRTRADPRPFTGCRFIQGPGSPTSSISGGSHQMVPPRLIALGRRARFGV